MRPVFGIAGYVLREAASRKFILAFMIGITLILLVLSLSLKLEVLDGALAATRLFGNTVHTSIRAVDVALRPLFQACCTPSSMEASSSGSSPARTSRRA